MSLLVKLGFNSDLTRFQYLSDWNINKKSFYGDSTRLFALYRHHLLDSKWQDGLITEEDLAEREEYMFYEGQFISHIEKCGLLDCPCQISKAALISQRKSSYSNAGDAEATSEPDDGSEYSEDEGDQYDYEKNHGPNRLKFMHLFLLNQYAKHSSLWFKPLLFMQLYWYFENLVAFRRNIVTYWAQSDS